jgi:hypothetical protein
MEFISLFLQILFWIFLAITLLGMIKPWWVLWFLDYKDRMSVLRYYGIDYFFVGAEYFICQAVIINTYIIA